MSTTSGIADAVRAVLASARHPRALPNICQPSQACSYQTMHGKGGVRMQQNRAVQPRERDIEMEKEGFVTSSI